MFSPLWKRFSEANFAFLFGKSLARESGITKSGCHAAHNVTTVSNTLSLGRDTANQPDRVVLMAFIKMTAGTGDDRGSDVAHEMDDWQKSSAGTAVPNGEPVLASRHRVYQTSADRTVGHAGTTTSNLSARLLQDHAARLTVTRPTATERSRLYAVLPTGLLTAAPHILQARLSETHDIYGQEIIESGVSGRALTAVARHCRSLKEPGTLRRILEALGGVIADLEMRGTLPDGLDICEAGDIDADWRYLGARNGVINLMTGRLLDPVEARWHRVSAMVPDEYDPDARHPLVDIVMPLHPDSDEQRWWHRYRGWALTHPVHRDLVAMGTPPNTGKTALRNCDNASMGDYVVTVGKSAWAQPRGYSATSTAHNGELTRMCTPARLAYSSELAPPLNTQVLNEITGGDRGTRARDVREKSVELRRPPHLIVQFNTGKGEMPVLPIGGKTESERALHDRTMCLPMPVIPHEKRDGRLLDIASYDKIFRQAWVARSVEQCRALLDSPDNCPTPPQGCVTMKEALARQAHAALPRWQTELVPRLFRPRESGDPSDVTVADSYTAYRRYRSFHETDGDGPVVSQSTFSTELKRHYGSSRRSKVRRAVEDQHVSRYVDAWLWPEWINAPDR